MSPGDVWLFMKKIKLIFVHEIMFEEFYKLKYCSTVVYMVPRA